MRRAATALSASVLVLGVGVQAAAPEVGAAGWSAWRVDAPGPSGPTMATPGASVWTVGAPGSNAGRDGAGSSVPVLRATAPGRRPQAGVVDERLRSLFARAESLFRSLDPQQARQPLSRVVDALAPAADAGGLSTEGQAMLVRSLAYRADVNLRGGDRDAADADFRRLLDLVPGASVEPFRLSDEAVARFTSVRADHVGYLEFSVDPPEASVRVDGVGIVVGAPQGHPVTAGTHLVEVELPGFTGIREEVEVRGGRRESLIYTLYRLSSVLRLMTSPPGATVTIDGLPMGETSGTAPGDFVPSGDAAGVPRTQISDELVIEHLMPGRHEIEVALPGYRTVRWTLQLHELTDYPLGVIVLERSLGTLLLRDLPHDATVWIDSRRVQPEPAPAGDPTAGDPTAGASRLPLDPGRHLLTVDAGAAGVFESELSVAEGQSLMVTVQLAPGITFLGVLGGDRLAANALDAALRDTLGGLTRWNLLDRVEQGGRLLRGSGVDAERLRSARAAETAIDWRRVQAATSGAVPGSVFAVAALNADAMAEFADLWLWAVEPGPAVPERLRIDLAGRGELGRLASGFDGVTAAFTRSRLGALLIDSDAAPSPVVAALASGSPAALSGLRVGDRIVSVAGNPVVTVANTLAWLDTFRSGDRVILGVVGADGGERTVETQLGSGPAVVSPSDPDRLYAPIWAAAASSVGRLDAPVPTWVLQLNEVAAFLHARDWQGAVDVLRRIDAPDRPGLGRAMVDHWLGLALSELGPEQSEAARRALERAAADADARYLYDDGPLLAPRSWARLALLDRAGR